jgi:hypothetical protein
VPFSQRNQSLYQVLMSVQHLPNKIDTNISPVYARYKDARYPIERKTFSLNNSSTPEFLEDHSIEQK